MEQPKFNIRIYGILIDDGKVLVTDEFRLGMFMTKFPGGALEYGEGIIDCLKREFKEELNIEVKIISHFYTTEDFFSTNLSPFESQLINVYYLVNTSNVDLIITTETKNDFKEIVDGAQCFRWVNISDLTEDEFTFPIDKLVASQILLEHG